MSKKTGFFLLIFAFVFACGPFFGCASCQKAKKTAPLADSAQPCVDPKQTNPPPISSGNNSVSVRVPSPDQSATPPGTVTVPNTTNNSCPTGSCPISGSSSEGDMIPSVQNQTTPNPIKPVSTENKNPSATPASFPKPDDASLDNLVTNPSANQTDEKKQTGDKSETGLPQPKESTPIETIPNKEIPGGFNYATNQSKSDSFQNVSRETADTGVSTVSKPNFSDACMSDPSNPAAAMNLSNVKPSDKPSDKSDDKPSVEPNAVQNTAPQTEPNAVSNDGAKNRTSESIEIPVESDQSQSASVTAGSNRVRFVTVIEK